MLEVGTRSRISDTVRVACSRSRHGQDTGTAGGHLGDPGCGTAQPGGDSTGGHEGSRGAAGDRAGTLGDTWTCHIPRPRGTEREERSSPGTCVSGDRRRIEPRPARCSSPYLGTARARQGPSPLPAPATPERRGDGDSGGTALGTGPLTLQLVADAVGHFLDLRRQLLQVIFGLCGIRGVNVPREGPRGQGRVWGHGDRTHSALGWGLRG